MRNGRNSARLTAIIWLSLCIVLLIASIGLLAYLSIQDNRTRQQQSTNLVSRYATILQLEGSLNSVLVGDADAVSQLKQMQAEIESFAAAGDSTNYVILSEGLQQLNQVLQNENVQWVLEERGSISELFDQMRTISERLSEKLEQIDHEVTSQGLETEEQHSQMKVLQKLIEVGSTLSEYELFLYSGNIDSVERFFAKIIEYDTIIRSVSDLNEPLSPVLSDIEALRTINNTLNRVRDSQDDLIIMFEQAEEFRSLLNSYRSDLSINVVTGKTGLSEDIIETPFGKFSRDILLIALGLVVLFILLSGVSIYRIASRSAKIDRGITEQNRKNEESILALLDVMTELAEGNLTVQAKVTDDITGTIADSFNYSIEELRGLVATVKKASVNVTKSVDLTSEVTEKLVEASYSQAAQISDATNMVMRMAQAMSDVSTQTSSSSEIATRSSQVARLGADRVRSTIAGMDQIREHIQETSKRIKRLGESSQEIGDIVELINDIADQTHILALNAAIQASAAGEAGRGFAVVADEVQRLAERTGNATKRVESLVKTIQGDTHEAVSAMEKSTSEVVNGANLAERAGEALNEIESVSSQLALLTQNVSGAAKEVSVLGEKVKDSMESIRQLTDENVSSTQIATNTVEQLHALAANLRESVSGFRIPE